MFPDDFVWGAGTSAYQIEGAPTTDGKVPSIWDDFCHDSDRIADRSSGVEACRHFDYWQQDVNQMATLGLQAYRFSIAWSRVLTDGATTINPKGIAFYDRLVDGLLENNIVPYITLFHWDLPQTLQHQGGWTSPQIINAFANYVDKVTLALGDRVKHWFTLNEPNIFALNGHLLGVHAPGLDGIKNYLSCMHNQLVAHGKAVQITRSNVSNAQVGLVTHQGLFAPLENTPEHAMAAKMADISFNRAYLDPIFFGQYPELIESMLAEHKIPRAESDNQYITTPIDILGVNHYTRYWVYPDPKSPAGFNSQVMPPDKSAATTSLDWEIYPEGIYQVLRSLYQRYQCRMIVTENGMANQDLVVENEGKMICDDPVRIEFIQSYLKAIHRAISEGVPVGGYFYWSLMDNFEWAEGYLARFGLLYVDYKTQERNRKSSADWFSNTILHNGF